MSNQERILLILDVDETLIHSQGKPIEGRTPDFMVGPYCVYRRPHLEHFLTACASLYDLAVWSSAGSDYLNAVIAEIMTPTVTPEFVWCRDHCTQRMNHETGDNIFIKDLKKVKRKGFDLRRMLIVEDTPQNVQRHYGNAIYVSSYSGNRNDEELLLLEEFLASIHSVANVRELEKRGWRHITRR